MFFKVKHKEGSEKRFKAGVRRFIEGNSCEFFNLTNKSTVILFYITGIIMPI